MDIAAIKKRVEAAIAASEQGQEAETDKFDFKLEWYNLKDKKGINEFIKDTSSIANTVGLDGFIVIGFDTRRNVFADSRMSQAGLRDTSDFRNLIIKHVDYAFELSVHDLTINGHQLSIIHIPPSIDKPHVIRNHYTNFDTVPKPNSNKIFVRKSTATHEATKADIELMFYDRKNIVPDYKLTTSLGLKHLYLQGQDEGFSVSTTKHSLMVSTTLTIENLGRRPVALNQATLSIKVSDSYNDEDWLFSSVRTSTPNIIKPNDIEIVPFILYFKSAKSIIPVQEFQVMSDSLNFMLRHFTLDRYSLYFVTNKMEALKSEIVDTSN